MTENGTGPLLELLALNTTLLRNALDGMSEQDAVRRVEGANPAGFLAAHVVDARYFLADLLHAPLPNPLTAVLGTAQSADDVTDLPTPGTILRAWDVISPHLARVIAGAEADQLARPSPQAFPVTDPSLLAGIAFLMQHESYHIGQIALLRRQLGYPAMSYQRREPQR